MSVSESLTPPRALFVVGLLMLAAACAEPPQGSSIDSAAGAGSAPLHPVRPAYSVANVRACTAFLSDHEQAADVGGHEFDGCVLGMARSHDKPNSLRIVVLARGGTIWVVDPNEDSFADDIAALVGTGDWVIVHKHWVSGTNTSIQSDHDFRLVQKATS